MASAVDECRLFKLPPELRNRIYRYTLVTSDKASPIQITNSGHERSGLLDTCKIIRSEALCIYYKENSFAIRIQDYDSTAQFHWMAVLVRLQMQPVQTTFTMTYRNASWPNLLQWLRRWHRDELCKRIKTPDERLIENQGDMFKHLLSCMFEVVESLAGQPWGLVEGVLSRMRPSLIADDQALANG